MAKLNVKQITSGLKVTTGGNLWMLRWRGFAVGYKNLRQRKNKIGLPESTDAEFCRFTLHQNVIFNRDILSFMLRLFADIHMFCL